jgi:hypothetical protein
MRRRLPQINQNFKGGTFKHVKSSDGTNLGLKGRIDATNGDILMESTSFLESSCTLPVCINIVSLVPCLSK